MRHLLVLFLFIFSLGAQEDKEEEKEEELPHPAAGFCKAMGINVYEVKLNEKESSSLYYVAQQYIRAHNLDIQDEKTSDVFWLTFETLISGVNSKKCYELIKLFRDIEDGKNKDQSLSLGNHLQTMKFSVARLQRGTLDQKKYAWMMAYSMNQISRKLKPSDFADYNTLFAMVDQSVQGMNWRTVQQKKFIPSIITAKVSKGTRLGPEQKLTTNQAFLSQNKAAIFNQASIKQIYTVSDDEGGSEVSIEEIKCRVVEGRSHRSTSFDFDIALSLNANVSFGEVVSFLSTRYPYLEPYKEVTFSTPEAINDDSSSSGLGLSLLLLSLYEGVSLDPNVISCADITVNGNIYPAYDMTDKIKKAATQQNSILLISLQDYQALMDAFIIWGHTALWSSQVIAVRDISEAISFARKDKTKDYLIAINEFREIQNTIRRNPQSLQVNRSKILNQLGSVLKKIPTHASARALYTILKGKIPNELSINTSLDLFSKTCKPVLDEMFDGKTASYATKNACSSRLKTIQKGLNKSINPLVEAMNKYIDDTKTKEPTEDDKSAFLREWKGLTKNRKFVDRMRR
ncbi:MAG: hypothetical protein NE328_23035 [Lentisphaeraceae bacterium]|nr:hypothetical protein [Lentisphaeraceae bacterium]